MYIFIFLWSFPSTMLEDFRFQVGNVVWLKLQKGWELSLASN
jgi:hypothetical protein